MDTNPTPARNEETATDSERPSPVTDDNRLWIPVETLAVLNRLGDVGVDGIDARIIDILPRL